MKSTAEYVAGWFQSLVDFWQKPNHREYEPIYTEPPERKKDVVPSALSRDVDRSPSSHVMEVKSPYQAIDDRLAFLSQGAEELFLDVERDKIKNKIENERKKSDIENQTKKSLSPVRNLDSGSLSLSSSQACISQELGSQSAAKKTKLDEKKGAYKPLDKREALEPQAESSSWFSYFSSAASSVKSIFSYFSDYQPIGDVECASSPSHKGGRQPRR